MQRYKYKALGPDGRKVSGSLEAFSQADAIRRLREEHSAILDLTEQKRPGLRSAPEEGRSVWDIQIGKPRLNNKAFTVLCSQFAIMLKAGIPVGRVVRLVEEKTGDRTLRRLLSRVGDDVEGGSFVADSFEQRGGDFLPVTFIETIRAGEASGNLDTAFASMRAHFEKQGKISKKVRGALAYPIFVLVIAAVVVAVLMVKVVPVFTEVFAEGGGEMPGMMAALISISSFFRRAWFIIAAAAAALVLGVRLYGRAGPGRTKLAKLRLRLPVIGNIEDLTAAGQFAGTMSTLMGAGLTLASAVTITAKVIGNHYLSQKTAELTEALEQGSSLNEAMRGQGLYPAILTDMVAVGEETGELEQTLRSISEYYDTELDYAVSGAVNKIQPGLLVFLAVVVGFIVIAVYSATFSMYDNMGA